MGRAVMEREQKPAGYNMACFCMTVIGIGYLFPIAAIWAAFDYWKSLFPDRNIEFSVTLDYQIVSLVTVMVLSVIPSKSFGLRIIGGFCGQFGCLLVVFLFRWFPFDRTTLLAILQLTVVSVACATAFLDSAIFSLCAQYMSGIQSYLQVGIGAGTLVSVAYRDATKLLMAGDIVDATTFYFSVALLTVLICILCYRVLMELPVSKIALGHDERSKALLGTFSPPGSPVNHAFFSPQVSPAPRYAGRLSPDIPGSIAEAVLNDFALDGHMQKCRQANGDSEEQKVAGAESSFSEVFRLVWCNQLTIFLNMSLTTLCYPGLLTSIPCRTFLALREDQWFQTICLTMFTLSDIPARLVTHRRFGLNHKNIFMTVLVRSVLFPLMLFCIMCDQSTDVIALAVVAFFGALNGYCVSISIITVNEVPGLSSEQRTTCGRITACSLNAGLAVGSLGADLVAGALGLSLSSGGA